MSEIEELNLIDRFMDISISNAEILSFINVFKSYQTGSNVMDMSGITCYVASLLLCEYKGLNSDIHERNIYNVSYVYAHLDKIFDSCDKEFAMLLYEVVTRVIKEHLNEEQIVELVNNRFSDKILAENNVDRTVLDKILKIGSQVSSSQIEKLLLLYLMKYEAKNSTTLEHACTKGAVTLMFIDCLMANRDDINSQSASINYSNYLLGAIVQLDDDVRDIKSDINENNFTYASSINNTHDFDNYVLSILFILSKLYDDYGELILLLTYAFMDASIKSGNCSKDLITLLSKWYHLPDDIDIWSMLIESSHKIADTLAEKLSENNVDSLIDDGDIDL